jgi:hypothetical protein
LDRQARTIDDRYTIACGSCGSVLHVPVQIGKWFTVIDEPVEAPAEVAERTRWFVQRVRWTLARTKDHEYIVRARLAAGLKDDYDRLWSDTLAFGWRGRYAATVHRYLSVDGRRYWTCTTVDCVDGVRVPCPSAYIGKPCVLNRASNDDLPGEPAQLSLEGQR